MEMVFVSTFLKHGFVLFFSDLLKKKLKKPNLVLGTKRLQGVKIAYTFNSALSKENDMLQATYV